MDDSVRSVCVVGAGLAGLSAARDMARAGHRVVVLEGADRLGGLASSLEVAGRLVERFYHFVCRGDDDLITLVDELGLGHRLHWRQSRTSFFFDGRLYGFASPFDLLRFSPVPVLERLRFGLNIVRSRYRRSWRELDALPAKDWLIGQIGERAYQVIWDPLLRIKFGDAHGEVSAAWIWHRIHRVAASRRRIWQREHLGYLERGSETVVSALAADLATLPGVTVRTGARVERIEVDGGRVTGVRLQGGVPPIPCDAVVSTVALPLLARLAPGLPEAYRDRLTGVAYLGVVCVLLHLRKRLSDSFWINIHDPRTAFNGLIEYSNLNAHLGLGEQSIVYVPQYLETSHPRFTMDDDTLLDECLDCLRLVNPKVDPSWVLDAHVARTGHAQAICPVGFAARVPDHRAPVAGLYLTDSTQYYPEDRTISAAIRLGRRVAGMVSQDFQQ